MNITKISWGIRALFYGMITEFEMPGYIGKPIYINKLKNIKFGRKVRIYPGIRAEVINKNGKISIGNNTSIGQNLHIISNDEELKLGNNVVISGNVFITNCDHSYQEIEKELYSQELVTKHTEIGDFCFIGYGTVIQAGTVLGKNCIVGANSVVRGIFPENCVIAGAPAKIIKKYNKESCTWERVNK